MRLSGINLNLMNFAESDQSQRQIQELKTELSRLRTTSRVERYRERVHAAIATRFERKENVQKSVSRIAELAQKLKEESSIGEHLRKWGS